MAALKALSLRSGLLLTIFAVLWFGLIGLIQAQDKASEEQTLIKAEELAGDSSNLQKVSSINSLKILQLELKEAIALFETIPPSAGSLYQQAQYKLTVYRTRLALVQNRLKVEEGAVANLEKAKNLANQAVTLGKNPPHNITVWQSAQAKWREANQLLRRIPVNTFVSAQAKQKQSAYTVSYIIVNERVKTEKAALTTLNSVQKLAKEANELSTNTSSSVSKLQKARAKWQQAISLASKIPTNTSVYAKAQEHLTSYNENARNIILFQNILEDQQRQIRLSAFESAWVDLGSQRQQELHTLKEEARGSRSKFVIECATSYRGRQAPTGSNVDSFSKEFCNYIWSDFKN